MQVMKTALFLKIKTMNSINQKYRPYFTSLELTEIISALKSQPTPSRVALIRYLEGFALKISHGIISSAHTLEPSIAEKLELDQSHIDAVNSLQSKRFNAYKKWRDSPEKCSPPEIELVQVYRYENDLMDPKEESEFELSMLQTKGI
jgi:hypothetical protein